MDVMQTPGAFSWSELLTTDPAKAAEFYASLFGWALEPMEMPNGTYRVAKLGETPIGGIMACPDASMPPMWGCYVTVADVEQTSARCTELGGAVLMPAFDIPNVGRMAVIKDPQGAMLSIISYPKR
jgi:predicted enzyme related to lactoylglutathione lyase